ncbi:Dyp-type peroxidase [Neptunicella marina]|uniref:Dyp-type peroxidase n=1 Tax=Neptunicella marina TaxID=2125989 RepID=A0A8J6ISB3_9ALTE|nr:Dyp-type peroxidase [Neptunicella marina]MBC3765374.1 Dyp-type peroxidase [Neptunicella marina]
MSQPQKGICAEPNLHALFLMFNVNDGQEVCIRQLLPKILTIFDHYDEEHYEAMVSGVVAIGSNYWMELYPGHMPELLAPFPDFSERDRSAPVVPADLFIQVRADRADICHAMGLDICELMLPVADLVEQVKGFRYLDGRDLTGFITTPDNPRGMKKFDVAIIGDEDPDFSGGCYMHVQRYQHQLTQWQQLSLERQQQIIGRYKDSGQALADEQLLPDSHLSKTRVTDDNGIPLVLLDQSMPYGDMKVQGVYFVSCAKSPVTFTRMLRNRILADKNGLYDRFLDYTTAETGAAFFAPSIQFIHQFAKQ